MAAGASGVCLAAGLPAVRAGLPDPPPVFQAGAAERQAVEFKRFGVMGTSNRRPEVKAVESLSLRSGNKALTFRARLWDTDDTFDVLINDKSVGIGKVFPYGTPKGAVPELAVSTGTQAIACSQDYAIAADKVARLTYTLIPLPEGRVQVEWAWDLSESAFNALTPKPAFSFCFFIRDYYRRAGVACNDRPLPLLPLDQLSPSQRSLKELTGPARVVIAPDVAVQSFGVAVGEGCTLSLMESGSGGKGELWIWVKSAPATLAGSFIVDLGATATKAASAPPPVAGVDFWERDRLHVQAPPTRNLMPNPGFEQGLRYWKWWVGGGRYVPSELPAYSVAADARFGTQALLVRNAGGGMPAMSFAIPVEKGADYTLSFYGKAEKDGTPLVLGVKSAANADGSKMGYQQGFGRVHKLTTAWERRSFTFTSDTAAVQLLLAPGASPVLIDGIQLEKGKVPTDFASVAVEGRLTTADPDNMIALGKPIQAAFVLTGTPGLGGVVDLTLLDYYRAPVYTARHPFTLDAAGTARIPLPFDDRPPGTGVFVLRADFLPEGQAGYSDYYRFSVLEFLENRHPGKDMCATLFDMRVTRANDLGRNFMRWGFGATSYNFDEVAEDQYRIRNFGQTIYDLIPKVLSRQDMTNYHLAMGSSWLCRVKPEDVWTNFTPERLKIVEDICYAVVKRYPKVPVWAPTCEIECHNPLVQAGRFDEWAKFLAAAYRGIKRANPDAIVMPDTGTSGLSRLRGFREQEGIMRATQGLVKWDAFGAHPYGFPDGADDLDDTTDRFIALMKRYGYGPETHIYYTEGFGCSAYDIPEWGDYLGDTPSYAAGWMEFLQAAGAARTWLIAMKYWPQVQTFNIWQSGLVMDQNLAPLYVCQVPNTLGHLLGNPTFKADIRPAEGIRGYAFEDDQRRGVAALWCTADKVQRGLERGPQMLVTFGKTLPEFIDLMGNARRVTPANGTVALQLTPAPLFLRSAAGGADELIRALQAAEVSGGGVALKVGALPTVDGRIELALANQTARPVTGNLSVGGVQAPFDVPGKDKTIVTVPGGAGHAPGTLYAWKQSPVITFADGRKDEALVDLAYFYVPHAPQPLPKDPDAAAWEAVPAIPLTNRFVTRHPAGTKTATGHPGDLEAKFQMAWDEQNLYLRVSATDDTFIDDMARWQKNVQRATQLYQFDGCLEVYLDTGANGRSNPARGFDQDDYRYDFYAGDGQVVDGPGSVYRLREVFAQLAGGLNFPTKEEAARRVLVDFRRQGNGYAYVIIFPQRYIEPLKLEKGWRAGFGLYLHDKEAGEDWPRKGLSLATEPGAHCDNRPDLWPIMILGE
jgi:hypothetical protein